MTAFLHSLRISCSRVNGVHPPLALAEAFLTDDDHTPRVRRLHLIIVDLKRRRRLATRVSKQLLKLKVVECAAQCWNTLPIPCKHDQDTYQMRYAHAMDGTDLPCYISDLSRQRIIPSGVLMHGKVIGFNWTDVASWPLLELNNFRCLQFGPKTTLADSRMSGVGYPGRRSGFQLILMSIHKCLACSLRRSLRKFFSVSSL